MEPNKLAASAANSMADSATSERSRVIAAEYSAKSLQSELDALLGQFPKDIIDEHKAKALRKIWDSFRTKTAESAADIARLEQGFEKLRQAIHRQVEERNNRYTELEQSLEELNKEVKLGDLKNSQQLEQKIISGLNRIKGLSAQRRQKIIGQLEQLEPKIKKLVSWRHWSTDQARQKVIDEIRNLHQTEKDLKKVAKRIQQARDEWKEWDRSGEGGDKKRYQEFDAVCSKAYEPCKKLFDAQKKQRAAASKHRKAVIDLLDNEYAKTDWRNPDWKHLQQLLREQSTRWRRLGAAEFRDRKPLQRRYEEITEKFERPLGRERRRNLKTREDLIRSITKLSEITDTRKAISELQVLKQQWMVTVSGKSKVEQEIWGRFTKACDAIYESSRQAKKDFDRSLEKNHTAKQAICEEIEQAVKRLPLTVEQINHLLNKWQASWTKAGKVPKAKIKTIDKRYKEAVSRVRRQLGEIQQASQARLDQQLFDLAGLCEETEALLVESNDAYVDAIKQRWPTETELLDDIYQQVRKRFDAAIEAMTEQTKKKQLLSACEQNFETINQYLLQLEINAGIDSPSAYAKQRMVLQIGRLSAAMGKAADYELLSNEQLIVKLHTTGIVNPAQQKEIKQRFKTCYEGLKK